MKAKKILITGCILGGLSVAIGAFGAHGLQDILIEHGRQDTFETAVKYQFYHTLALLLTGVLMLKNENRFFMYAVYSMVGGIVVFSGSLYILCITNITVLGAVTPIGGLLFILGWIFLGTGVSKSVNPGKHKS